jgi:hypothetical protein
VEAAAKKGFGFAAAVTIAAVVVTVVAAVAVVVETAASKPVGRDATRGLILETEEEEHCCLELEVKVTLVPVAAVDTASVSSSCSSFCSCSSSCS